MMKYLIPVLFISVVVTFAACSGKGQAGKDAEAAEEISAVPDTGYTGIKQYFSSDRLVKEVTFENGVREGLMKTFYPGGQLYQTFWYENGVREDSAVWYYLEGQVFRTTPYRRDTVDGLQKQYYRTGRLKAQIGYDKGLRTPFLEEYDQNGKVLKNYPEIVTGIVDRYDSGGTFTISLSMSDNTSKVSFYRGDFTDGRFDTTHLRKLETSGGKASLVLKKTGSPSPAYIGVIAEIITPFGNRNFVYKKIDLPYSNLN